MATDILSAHDCYVYILYREDGITPFYVGKGRGRRWQSHEVDCRRRRSHKDSIVRRMVSAGIPIPKRKIAEGLQNAEACELEMLLIDQIGRKHQGGPLANVTAGGEGNYDPTPEHREKLRIAHLGFRPSAYMLQRSREANTGRPMPAHVMEAVNRARRGMHVPPALRAQIAAKLIGRKNGPHSAETKAKISAAHKGKARGKQGREVQAKRSASLKANWASMPKEKRQLRGMIGKHHSEETKAKMAESHRRYWESLRS